MEIKMNCKCEEANHLTNVLLAILSASILMATVLGVAKFGEFRQNKIKQDTRVADALESISERCAK